MNHSHHGPELADIVPGLELPSKTGRAVDVGCGAGDDVRWLHGAGFEAVGIDASAEALKVAASRTPDGVNVSWVEGDATSLPLEDQSCVLVSDRGCLHHLPAGRWGRYAGEVERVLVTGGAWVIRDAIGHHHQVAELDEEAIAELARGTSLQVESCVITGDAGPHRWLLAILRKP